MADPEKIRFRKRRDVLAGAVAAIFAAILAGLGLGVKYSYDERRAEEEKAAAEERARVLREKEKEKWTKNFVEKMRGEADELGSLAGHKLPDAEKFAGLCFEMSEKQVERLTPKEAAAVMAVSKRLQTHWANVVYAFTQYYNLWMNLKETRVHKRTPGEQLVELDEETLRSPLHYEEAHDVREKLLAFAMYSPDSQDFHRTIERAQSKIGDCVPKDFAHVAMSVDHRQHRIYSHPMRAFLEEHPYYSHLLATGFTEVGPSQQEERDAQRQLAEFHGRARRLPW